MIFGGGNPATATTEIMDSHGNTAALGLRPIDVAGAHRDERHDPAQWQSARDGRFVCGRKRLDRQSER